MNELRKLVTHAGGEPGPEIAPLTLDPLLELARIRRSPQEQTRATAAAVRQALFGDG